MNTVPQIQIANAAKQQRITRSPSHDFWLRFRPYQIQPFMTAPVLPGETLTSAFLQARSKTPSLKSQFLGWWLEHYVFYVRLRDLPGREDFVQMILQADYDLSAYDRAMDTATYHAGTGVDWTRECLEHIVEEYFRDETDGTVNLDGLPQAALVQSSWLDSVKPESEQPAPDHQFPGETPVVPDGQSAEFSAHYAQFQHMQALGLVSASFEDWLKSFGVVPATKDDEEEYRPELLRYVRDFQYPSVAVDGDGSASGRVVWSTAERLDKKRFFKEPGFVIGLTVARPKVYLSKQIGAASAALDDAYAWLPAVLRDHPFTSLKRFDPLVGGPLGNTPAEAYWVDLRDLFMHGDQMVNFDLSTGPAGTVALPGADLQRRFAASADIDKLFTDAVAENKVESEGNARLNILGRLADHT